MQVRFHYSVLVDIPDDVKALELSEDGEEIKDKIEFIRYAMYFLKRQIDEGGVDVVGVAFNGEMYST